MEENKIKKKRTLSVSTRKTHNPPNYVQSGRKTSVVIEKKTTKRQKSEPEKNKLITM